MVHRLIFLLGGVDRLRWQYNLFYCPKFPTYPVAGSPPCSSTSSVKYAYPQAGRVVCGIEATMLCRQIRVVACASRDIVPHEESTDSIFLPRHDQHMAYSRLSLGLTAELGAFAVSNGYMSRSASLSISVLPCEGSQVHTDSKARVSA